MERTAGHILRGVAAALLLACGAACKHAPQYVYVDRGTGKPIAEAKPDSMRVECPTCYRMLVCCQGRGFSVDGEEPAATTGVAWACPVHGYVATTPEADPAKRTCTHWADKAPARIVDPEGVYPPALLLRCKECGAGGLLILEQKGNARKFYCAD